MTLVITAHFSLSPTFKKLILLLKCVRVNGCFSSSKEEKRAVFIVVEKKKNKKKSGCCSYFIYLFGGNKRYYVDVVAVW